MTLRSLPFRIVGAVFVVAATMKAFSPSGLFFFLEFIGLSAGLSRGASLVIIAAEGALGVALLIDPNWRALRWLTTLLAISFLTVPVVRWLWPEAPGCGCFGTWANHPALDKPLFEFGRGLLLLGLLVLGMSASPPPKLLRTPAPTA